MIENNKINDTLGEGATDMGPDVWNKIKEK